MVCVVGSVHVCMVRARVCMLCMVRSARMSVCYVCICVCCVCVRVSVGRMRVCNVGFTGMIVCSCVYVKCVSCVRYVHAVFMYGCLCD